MGVKETFKKQGGFKLIKQYSKSGSLFTAVNQFVVLGKSRTALEILRLSASLKTKKKLTKKYSKYLKEFDNNYVEKEHVASNKVWVCWFQGIENAPAIVKRCYQSLKDNLINQEIILLTDDNIKDYVTFPDFIQEKYDNGIITKTHMTDLLRLELLIKYGGTWIDSTVLCTSNDVPDYMLNSDLFMFQTLKPGRDGHSTVNSSWYMSAKTNNKILEATKYLIYKYWEKNNSMIDYFLLHDFISIVADYYKEDWNKIIPFSNSTPHILLLRLFEKYDEELWNATLKQTPFHKLTYKFDGKQEKLEGTYYKKVMGEI